MKRNQFAGQVYCVDLAKDKFQVHSYRANGERIGQKSMTRTKFRQFVVDPVVLGCLVVMEACAGAHFWARTLIATGARVKLVPPQFVAKMRHGNKTDANDTDAIKAVDSDPRVKPVPVKTVAQQDLCATHCVRELLNKQRTQLINQARGLLTERGIVGATKEAGFWLMMNSVVEAPPSDEVTSDLLALLQIIAQRIRDVDAELHVIELRLKDALKRSPSAQRVDKIFGVGLIIATAVDGKFGDNVDRFADARQFSASIGTTPREHSSGKKRYLGSITGHGDPYLRKLVVQGANAVVNAVGRRDDAICLFAKRLLEKHKRRNVVVVAVANRLLRIIYAVIKHRSEYQPNGRLRAA